MPGRFGRRFEVPEDDVQRLMNCIVEHARPDEERDVERILGVLAALQAHATRREGDDTVTFVAPLGTTAIVERALAGMARSDRHQARARRMGARG
jgi:hypothetical protein